MKFLPGTGVALGIATAVLACGNGSSPDSVGAAIAPGEPPASPAAQWSSEAHTASGFVDLTLLGQHIPIEIPPISQAQQAGSGEADNPLVGIDLGHREMGVLSVHGADNRGNNSDRSAKGRTWAKYVNVLGGLIRLRDLVVESLCEGPSNEPDCKGKMYLTELTIANKSYPIGEIAPNTTIEIGDAPMIVKGVPSPVLVHVKVVLNEQIVTGAPNFHGLEVNGVHVFVAGGLQDLVYVDANVIVGGPSASSGDRCSLPAETGPCSGRFAKWRHNAATGQCEEFDYGGCSGNANRFDSSNECEAACRP